VSSEVAILLSAALIVTIAVALLSKSVSVSLITLFYASLVLGIIFATYGGIVVGIVHVITFAGAISVLLLTVVLMTGESKLAIGSRQIIGILTAVSTPVIAAAMYELLQGLPVSQNGSSGSSSTSLFQFLWQFRPWDLLILIMVFASSMIAVANLMSTARRTAKE